MQLTAPVTGHFVEEEPPNCLESSLLEDSGVLNNNVCGPSPSNTTIEKLQPDTQKLQKSIGKNGPDDPNATLNAPL